MTRKLSPLGARRAYLTPKERVEHYQRQKGLCGCGCGQPLSLKDSIGEHKYLAVALGNDGKPDCLYRSDCADRKTNGLRGDKQNIAHVKRLALHKTQADKRKLTGAKLFSSRRLLTRGFDKTLSKKFDGTVIKNGR